VVFVGFNPGEISAQRGHYYANPRNPFWNFLFEAGIVPIRLDPKDDHRMPEFGLGLTDLVKRPTASASDLRDADYVRGRQRLEPLLRGLAPRVVVFNGKGVYRKFRGRCAGYGWQRERLGKSRIFVLPSTSPANRGVTRAEKLAYFRRLAREVRHAR
jgi:double-stranded uracil-DNA glycosylase